MKYSLLAVLLLIGTAWADIQDPPSNDYGPTRKLGRGLSNFFFGQTEAFVMAATVNTNEGNAAAAGYGVVRGVGRAQWRHLVGLYEIFTFPFPSYHQSFYPVLRPDIPYIHAGYSEFPPEPGNESKYPWVRDY